VGVVRALHLFKPGRERAREPQAPIVRRETRGLAHLFLDVASVSRELNPDLGHFEQESLAIRMLYGARQP
jgi:hypothetical protein